MGGIRKNKERGRSPSDEACQSSQFSAFKSQCLVFCSGTFERIEVNDKNWENKDLRPFNWRHSVGWCVLDFLTFGFSYGVAVCLSGIF